MALFDANIIFDDEGCDVGSFGTVYLQVISR
jgi:hypothetical protein